MSGLRFTDAEIGIVEDYEREQYNLRFPVIQWQRRTTTQSPTATRFGVVLTPDTTVYNSTTVDIHADFDFDRRHYKIENGIRIKTNEIDVILCAPELQDLGITVQENDLLIINSVKYIVLRVEPMDMIPSTLKFLHTIARIDLQNMIKD